MKDNQKWNKKEHIGRIMGQEPQNPGGGIKLKTNHLEDPIGRTMEIEEIIDLTNHHTTRDRINHLIIAWRQHNTTKVTMEGTPDMRIMDTIKINNITEMNQENTNILCIGMNQGIIIQIHMEMNQEIIIKIQTGMNQGSTSRTKTPIDMNQGSISRIQMQVNPGIINPILRGTKTQRMNSIGMIQEKARYTPLIDMNH